MSYSEPFYRRFRKTLYPLAMFIAKVRYSYGLARKTATDIRDMWVLVRKNAQQDLLQQLDQQRFSAELKAAYDKGTFSPLTALTLDPEYTTQTKLSSIPRYPFPTAGRTYGHRY